VVALAADELALDDLVALVTHVVVQRLDGRLEVHTLGHGLDLVLAVRAPVVVVRALEDEAHAFGCEADIAGLAPTEEVERELRLDALSSDVLPAALGAAPPTLFNR
jgi:hypothetical protein